ncbi:MAG: gephyrin-like molybdotransferase Glp [Thermoanaerobaculia bacterium]
MLTPEAAWRLIAAEIEPLPPRETTRAAAAGHVLAAPLTATVDQPPADVSAMDGYVVHGEVAAGDPIPVRGTVAAGPPPELELAAGEAAKIMTGAVVPPGGDRVIPVEQTDGGDELVRFRIAPEQGAHIRRGGEVIRAGAPLLERGALLTPGAVSALASHGYASVSVVREPAVAVMTTGDEVIPPEEQPAAGQLRDSNTSFLLAAGRSLGLGFRSLGIARDEVEVLRDKIREGLEDDVLLLCGGVSMGEYDLVEDVLAELGCEQLFDRVAIQPGKPLVAARHPGGWVFGLPGNPASVMVTFWLFVRPLLRRLQGLPGGFWEGALAAELTAPLPPSKGRDRFLPAAIAFEDGKILATPRPPRGSHDVVAYAHDTALVRVHRDAEEPAAAGERCEILPLGNWG